MYCAFRCGRQGTADSTTISVRVDLDIHLQELDKRLDPRIGVGSMLKCWSRGWWGYWMILDDIRWCGIGSRLKGIGSQKGER